MTDYCEEWNFLVIEHIKNKNESEDKIQSLWESYLTNPFQFGYSSEKELMSKISLHIGSKTIEIPDIVLSINEEKICVIELKRYNLSKSKNYEDQLLNYMGHTDLYIPLGVLICDKLYIYWRNFAENKTDCLEIPFEFDNENGIKFVELFCKQNFDLENIHNFIKDKNNSKTNIENIRNEITKELIEKLLRQYFSSGYSKDDFDKAFSDINIEVGKKQHFVVNNVSSPAKTVEKISVVAGNASETVCIKGVTIPCYRNSEQTVQDFIKQTLKILFDNNLLSLEEIKRMQDKDYSDRTFGIQFPLLQADFNKIVISGHARYWTKFKVSNFYVCLFWWKGLSEVYDVNIASWLRRLECDSEA